MAPLEEMLRKNMGEPGPPVICALRGLPGAGKTTLAADLARRLAVRREFRDGIFWVTLDENPADILGLVGGFIQELGDRTYEPRELQTAAGHLKTLFRTKRALIIVDDAWNAAHVDPFLADGPRCRVLVTTREAAVGEALEASVFFVDDMTPGEALALIAARLRRSLTSEEQAWALELVELLGRLPIALNLAATQLRGELGWEELLAELRKEMGRLAILEPLGSEERDSESRRAHSVTASFEVSIKRLNPELIRAFAWLGVLRPGLILTGARLTTLWGLDEAAASERLRYLADRSLLVPGAQAHAAAASYRIHDLMRDMAKLLIVAPATGAPIPGLGLAWTEAQSQFLERFRATAPAPHPAWPDVPDDGYLYVNLSWHLEESGRTAELFALIESDALEGGRRWYEACELRGNISVFLTSVQEIRRIAEEDFGDAGDPAAWGRAMRCVLLLATVNSIAAMPPEFFVALVRGEIWTLDQALVYARRQAGLTQRLPTLIALIAGFPERIGDDLFEEIGEEIKGLSHEDFYFYVLPLAPHLGRHPVVAAKILKSIRYQPIEPDWIRLVSKLLPFLQLEEAVKYADRNRPQSCDDDSYWAWAVAVLAPYAGPDGFSYALENARKIRYLNQRALALAYLALRGDPAGREALVRQALRAFLTVSGVFDWAELFRELQPILDANPVLAKEALDAALEMYARHSATDPQSDRPFAHVLEALAKAVSFTPELLDRALQAARSVKITTARTQALSALASHVGEPQRSQIIREVESLTLAESQEKDRAAMMVRLADLMPPQKRRELLTQARRYYTTIGDRQAYFDAFIGLLEGVAPDHLKIVMLRAAHLGDAQAMPDTIASLAACLLRAWNIRPDATSAEADLAERFYFSLALLFDEESIPLFHAGLEASSTQFSNDKALMAIAERVSPGSPLVAAVLAAMRALPAKAGFIRVLEKLFAKIAPDDRNALMDEAAASIEGISQESGRHEATVRLAGLAGGRADVLERLWHDAHSMSAPMRALMLVDLAPLFDETTKSKRTVEAWGVIHDIGDRDKRFSAMRSLVALLAPEERPAALAQAWSEAEAVAEPDRRSRFLSGLVPFTDRDRQPGLVLDILRVAASTGGDSRAEILIALAKSVALDQDAFRQALAMARAMHDSQNLAATLAYMVPHAPPDDRIVLFKESMRAARKVKNDEYEWFLRFLFFIALPNCPEHEIFKLLKEALAAVLDDDAGANPFLLARAVDRLLPYTNEQLIPVIAAAIDVLARNKRKSLLVFLSKAHPLLAKVCGSAGNAETLVALTDVVRRFP